MAKEFLSQNRISYTEHNVALDPKAAQEMVRLSGQRGVPVIVVDGEVIVGFDRPRLERLLLAKREGSSLGLRVTDATKASKERGLPVSVGAYVDRVNPGSPAEKAGVQPGDVITEINGWPVASAKDLKVASVGLQAGKRASMTVLRGGKALKIQVQL